MRTSEPEDFGLGEASELFAGGAPRGNAGRILLLLRRGFLELGAQAGDVILDLLALALELGEDLPGGRASQSRPSTDREGRRAPLFLDRLFERLEVFRVAGLELGLAVALAPDLDQQLRMFGLEARQRIFEAVLCDRKRLQVLISSVSHLGQADGAGPRTFWSAVRLSSMPLRRFSIIAVL